MPDRSEIFKAIVAERQRQEKLKADGHFKHTCADLEMTTTEKVAVLGEEFGEVCKAALEVEKLAKRLSDVHNTSPWKYDPLRQELIEVCAVAVAWLEAIDAKQNT
jgi:hypothetical protein